MKLLAHFLMNTCVTLTMTIFGCKVEGGKCPKYKYISKNMIFLKNLCGPKLFSVCAVVVAASVCNAAALRRRNCCGGAEGCEICS